MYIHNLCIHIYSLGDETVFNIGTLEDAFRLFTATEKLDKENKWSCSACGKAGGRKVARLEKK